MITFASTCDAVESKTTQACSVVFTLARAGVTGPAVWAVISKAGVAALRVDALLVWGAAEGPIFAFVDICGD